MRWKILLASVAIATLLLGMAAGYTLAQSSSLTTILEAGSLATPANYVVFSDGSMYYARNGLTGEVEFSGSDFATVVQNAINALPTSGGKIHIKAGNYTVSQTIILKDYLTLEGEGPYATILYLEDGANCDILATLGPVHPRHSYITIRDLRLEGNKDNNPTAGRGIHLVSAWKCHIENVHVLRCRQEGIKLYGSTAPQDTRECYIENCYVAYCAAEGIKLSYCVDCFLIHVYIEGCGGYGVAAYSSPNSYYHVHAYNCLEGLHVEGDKNVLVECHGDTAKRHGIHVEGDRNILVGCYAYKCSQESPNTYAGIALEGSHNTVMGCRCIDYQSTPTQAYGIQEISGDHNVITGCIVGLGNTVAPMLITGAHTRVADCVGYVSEAEGVAYGLSDGSLIAHGLAGTPSVVVLTALNATYDGVPVIVSWDEANTNSTHIAVHILWANGTPIADNVIAVAWIAKL